jgi:tetraacyldisaccharide 4'-kinase
VAQTEPSWWYSSSASWQRTALRPIASLYGHIATARYSATTPERAARPVICVGNYTAGGTGKTPMALLVADIVAQHGGAPWFLSRGYGGRLDGQERVDPTRHTAAQVGDEPLLLAARAPTVVSRDRRLGAEFIARQAPANAVIIMDDGLQNPALAKSLTIALVDAARGLGNGAVIPAGPLRAPLAFQLARTDLIVINGAAGTRARDQLSGIHSAARIEKLSAAPVPRGETTWLSGARVLAFAGIANPERFFALLERLGAIIVERVVFGDHETLSNAAAENLLSLAETANTTLVTTEKDFVRLSGLDGARVILKERARPVPIVLQMTDGDRAILSKRIGMLTG